MDLLHITSIRRGADGDPKSQNAANYDESKADSHRSCRIRWVLKNGEKVNTAEIWWTQRRPEIVEDFDREIYGRVPRDNAQGELEVISTTREKNGEVPVITKKIVGNVDDSSYPPD